jgi:hypothetical protein
MAMQYYDAHGNLVTTPQKTPGLPESALKSQHSVRIASQHSHHSANTAKRLNSGHMMARENSNKEKWLHMKTQENIKLKKLPNGAIKFTDDSPASLGHQSLVSKL